MKISLTLEFDHVTMRELARGAKLRQMQIKQVREALGSKSDVARDAHKTRLYARYGIAEMQLRDVAIVLERAYVAAKTDPELFGHK